MVWRTPRYSNISTNSRLLIRMFVAAPKSQRKIKTGGFVVSWLMHCIVNPLASEAFISWLWQNEGFFSVLPLSVLVICAATSAFLAFLCVHSTTRTMRIKYPMSIFDNRKPNCWWHGNAWRITITQHSNQNDRCGYF